MSADKFTPAPWIIVSSTNVDQIETSDGKGIATVWGKSGEYVSMVPNEQAIANAKLIEQSPSMLTALINLLEHREGTVEGDEARKEAEEIIKKVRE
jgi:hypothetical protein